MSMNQDLFNLALKGVLAQLDGSSPTDVEALEDRLEIMYKAANPLAYDPSNAPAVMTPAQYGSLFNFGFSAITDAEGETLYFDENYELDALKAQFAYLVADPASTSAHRSQPANQAVAVEMLKLLDRSAGSASDELALYATGVIEDALSMGNRCPAVLSDAYRAVLADILEAFKADGADAVVLDRLESLLTQRNPTRLIVDDKGAASPDAGEWA